ncbi:MAG: hypothetical protein ACLQMH_12325 [Solirubrobacteraceae bacterium]
MRVRTLLLLPIAMLIGAAGCGGSHQTSTPAELRLQRADLVAVSRELQALEGPVAREVAPARAAWPLVAKGLARAPASAQPSISAAATAAASIRQPQLFDEANASSLTGPASVLAGQFRTFDGLATRGWQLIGAAIAQIDSGPPSAARFARENVALYIDSVYDGHFTLAQVGKALALAYAKLGGAAAFGRALSPAEVQALSSAYSEPTVRLEPHPTVRLGS